MKRYSINNIYVRISALLLTLAMLAALCGCGEDETLKEREQLIEELYGSVELAGTNDTISTDATTSNFILPYTRGDTFNPYMCESTLNATITDLLYDQLITVNSEFEADMVMAASVEHTNSHMFTLVLRDGIVFSDGSELSGRDIKYSLECAKADGSRYQKQLRNIAGCMSQDNTVYFRLEEPDPRAYMLLDFPIVKYNTAGGTGVPVGSGRYYYVSDPEKGTFLLRNSLWYSNNYSDVSRISLVSMPTIESIVHSIEIGTVSYYFTDLRDGYPSRINANYATIDINNLVFVGVNTTSPGLNSFGVRDAINKAINREEIITNAYAGRAYAATGPMTNSWAEAASAQNGSTLSDPEEAAKVLHSAGFVNIDQQYIRSNNNGERLQFNILVNTENSQHIAVAERISEQLALVGISASVQQLPYADYRAAIASGNYTMYIGEYSLYNNMDFSDLYTPNRGMYFGLTPQTTINACKAYREGTGTLAEFVEAFDSELPFIPVCYRLGMVCYSRSLSANMNVTESDLFHDMHLWDVALADSPNVTNADGETAETTAANAP